MVVNLTEPIKIIPSYWITAVLIYKNWREIVGAVNLELMPLEASMILVAASFDMPRLAVRSRSLYE